MTKQTTIKEEISQYAQSFIEKTGIVLGANPYPANSHLMDLARLRTPLLDSSTLISGKREGIGFLSPTSLYPQMKFVLTTDTATREQRMWVDYSRIINYLDQPNQPNDNLVDILPSIGDQIKNGKFGVADTSFFFNQDITGLEVLASTTLGDFNHVAEQMGEMDRILSKRLLGFSLNKGKGGEQNGR